MRQLSLIGYFEPLLFALFSTRRKLLFIPVRGFDPEHVMYKKILQHSLSIGSAGAVSAARKRHHTEGLVGLDQGVYNLERGGRVHVSVHLSANQ